jgi:uncharacterized protein YktB (UPF0637 family)
MRPFNRETFNELGQRFKTELPDLLTTEHRGKWALLRPNMPNEYWQAMATAYQRGLQGNETFFIGQVAEPRTYFFTRAQEYFRF